MKRELEGRVALVTGALGAVGSSIAIRLLEEGATVIAAFRGEIARFESLRSRTTGAIHPWIIDIADDACVQGAIADIIRTFSRIDILVNNAGVNESLPFAMMDDAAWNRVVDTNLTGVKRMCAAVAGPMMSQRAGSIINLSSALATVLGRGSAAYAASKAALERFTEVAAVELGRKGIRVNAVAPGLLDGGMGIDMHPNAEAMALDRTPLGRKGTLAEVAEAVLFLATSRSSFVTGHILAVDGGLTCG